MANSRVGIIILLLTYRSLVAADHSVSIGSMVVGTAQPWEWTVFLKGTPDALAHIKCVEYVLDPTFPNPHRTVCTSGANGQPFASSGTTWGVFDMSVIVTFDDKTTQTIRYTLNPKTLSQPRCVKTTVKERTWMLVTPPGMDHPITLALADLYRVDRGPDASRLYVIDGANVYSGPSKTFDKNTPRPPANITAELRFSGHKTVNKTFPPLTISGRMFTVRIVQLDQGCLSRGCQTATIEICEAGR
jgi:hypothetical protein